MRAQLSRNRTTRHGQQLVLVMLLILSAGGATTAQSNDRDTPTPISSNTIKGTGVGKKVEYYYSFSAGPGEVVLTIDLKAKSGSTGADVEVFDAGSNKIFYFFPNATSTNERAVRRFKVANKETVVLRLAFDIDAGDYTIKLGGAVELAAVDSSPRGVTPPPTSLPDLIVKEISFEQAPSQIRVQVINRGNAPSSNCFLALQSLADDDPSRGTKQRVWTIEIPALEVGKGFSNVIDVSPLTQTSSRWKATVDRSNTVKESNEDNNSLLFPAGSDGPSRGLPDLVIDHFEVTNPSKGEVKIQVTNQGGGSAATSTLRLIVWKAGKFEQKEVATVFARVPALASGQTTSIVVMAAVPIRRTKHSLSIDISEDVK